MCKGGGSNPTTTTTQSGPPSQVLQNYDNVYKRALGVADSGTGGQAYEGQTVAPMTDLQRWSQNNYLEPSEAYYRAANPAYQKYQDATQPVWTSDVSSAFAPGAAQAYLSPYIGSVVDATQNQFNEQNARQQQGVIGNAISQGAWGGDRSAVAQGIVANQQQLAQAPVIAGLYNQGYQSALQSAQTAAQARLGATEADRWLASQAGAGLGNIAQMNYNVTHGAVSSAAQLGQQQQQQFQAEYNVPYANWLRATSYPYQSTNWLANIAEGIGGLSGAQGSTTTPGPSTASQALGLGLGGVGLLGKTGAFGSDGYLTNLFGGGGGGDGNIDAITGAGLQNFFGANGTPIGPIFERGGRIDGRDAGGRLSYGVGGRPMVPPFGAEIPDLSISMMPAGNPAAAGHGGLLSQPQITQTQSTEGGGGGGGIGSAVGTALGIAKLGALFLGRGGGVRGYEAGGSPEFDWTSPQPEYSSGLGMANSTPSGEMLAYALPEDLRAGLAASASAAPIPTPGLAPAAPPAPTLQALHADASAPPSPAEGVAPSASSPYHADPWMALATAGFATAAGRSPHALQNIGAGALEGMKFYEAQRRFEPEARLKGAQAQTAEIQAGLTKAAVDYYKNRPPDDDLAALTGNVDRVRKTAQAPASAAEPPGGDAVAGFKALLPIETNGDPNAVSSAGAVGLSQILPSTAEQYLGRKVSADELKDATFNLKLGQTIYSDLLRRYNGDQDAAWAGYNAGPAVGDKYLASGKDPSVLPKETQAYIQKARANLASIGSGAPDQIVQVPVAGGRTVAMPSTVGDGRYPILDRQYARIMWELRNPLLPLRPEIVAAQETNLTRLYEADPRIAAAKAAEIERAKNPALIARTAGEAAEKGKVELGVAAGMNPILAQRAGQEETQRMRAAPQTYVTEDLTEAVAPRGDVMAGTAPGMTSAGPRPGAQAGKYDPDPESLVRPAPGVAVTQVAPQDKDRLAADAKTYSEYRVAAEGAPQTIQRTQELRDILQRLKTGRTLNAGQDALAWARSAGLEGLIPRGYDPSDAEMVNKLATSLVFEQLKAIGGRPMVAEIQGLQSANANISLTPQANLDIIGNIDAAAKYTRDRFQQASQVWTRYHQLGNFDEKYLRNSPLGQIFDQAKREMTGGQTDVSRILAKHPDARQSPDDGQWYIERNGKYLRAKVQ